MSVSSLFSPRWNRSTSVSLLSLFCSLLSSCSDPEPEDDISQIEESVSESVVGIPLNTPSLGSGGGTLFERLSPTETGVNFENGIVENHPLRHLYATEKVCGGVAVGDVDGNGFPDLFFTNGPRGNRLFLQTEEFKFSDQTAASGLKV